MNADVRCLEVGRRRQQQSAATEGQPALRPVPRTLNDHRRRQLLTIPTSMTSNDLERHKPLILHFFHRIQLLCWSITSQWLKLDL